MMNQFKNKAHQLDFEQLMEQSELELNRLHEANGLVRRQIAFLYLVAMYQEAYERYEGMKFYVEVYEEMSIDGPVYLLEDQVKLEDFAHEKILKVAKDILRGIEPNLEPIEAEDRVFAKKAYEFSR